MLSLPPTEPYQAGFLPKYGYFRRNRRRDDYRWMNENLKIEAKIKNFA